MDVGGRVKYFREKMGITVNRLATISGVSQSNIRDIELGKKQPTVEYLEYICDALHITLREFFSVNSEEPTVEDALNHLNEKQKELLLAFLKSI